MEAMGQTNTTETNTDTTKQTNATGTMQRRSARQRSSLSSNGLETGKVNGSTHHSRSTGGRGSDDRENGNSVNFANKAASAASVSINGDGNKSKSSRGKGQVKDFSNTQNGTAASTGTPSSSNRSASPATLKAIEDIQKMDQKRAHFTRSKRKPGEKGRDSDQSTTSKKLSHRLFQSGSSKKKKKNHQQQEDDDDDLDECAKILARLDERSYQRDVLRDANRLLEGLVLPMCFPWNHPMGASSPIKNVPRDIDDMPDILHFQDDETYAPFENGAFGYGKFETGKDVYRNEPPPHAQKHGDCDEVRLATRRSNDVGVIELTALATPKQDHHFSSTASMDEFNKNKALAFCEADKIEQVSTVSKYLANSSNSDSSSPQKKNSEGTAANELYLEETEMNQDDLSVEGEVEYRNYRQTQANKRLRIDMGMAYTSKLFVSLRVESVSSRSSIFPSNPSAEEGGNDKNLYPLLRVAFLPAEVQTGKHVNVDTAMKLDQAGVTNYLGSYDVRYGSTSAGAIACKSGVKRKETLKDAGGRMKRTFAGRGRLLWSTRTRVPGAAYNRFMYKSILKGNRLEGGTFKRPRHVKVGVKINGNLLVTDTPQEDPLPKTLKKAKGAASAGEDNDVYFTDKILNPAFTSACRRKHGLVIARGRPNLPIQVSSIMPYTRQTAMCMLDCDELLKFAKGNNKTGRGKEAKRKAKSSARVKTEDSTKNRPPKDSFKPPQLDCLPLSEASIRVVCTVPGKMEPRSIRNIFESCSIRKDGTAVCTVCWSGESKGGAKVHQCVDCGVRAHLQCCTDKGRMLPFPPEGQDGSAESPGELSTEESPSTDHDNASTERSSQWQCAACSHYRTSPQSTSSSKPAAVLSPPRRSTRRSAKVPRRFQAESNTLSGDDDDEGPKESKRSPPPPRQCVLCPHSGGAMSPNKEKKEWAHEVCRIWTCNGQSAGSTGLEEDTASTHPILSRMTETCAVCGSSKNDKTKQRQVLVKCAARGCHVRFHPMCALLATKLQEQQVPNPEEAAIKTLEDVMTLDSHLCKQYTLSFVNCTRTEGAFGCFKGKTKSSLLPIAFCGLHNPKRSPSLYACPPQGFGSAVMRVPPRK